MVAFTEFLTNHSFFDVRRKCQECLRSNGIYKAIGNLKTTTSRQSSAILKKNTIVLEMKYQIDTPILTTLIPTHAFQEQFITIKQ